MLVQRLFVTQKKAFAEKAPYQRPVYKSYKDLLRLDRPRKKIEYYSSDEQEDFLQKLLNEQKKRSTEKKGKKSRKSTGKTVVKSDKAQLAKVESKQKVNKLENIPVKKQQNKPMSEIELFLAQAKSLSKQDQPLQMKEELTEQKQVKPRPTKTAKSKSSTNLKIQPTFDKRKQLRKDVLVSNPIFIDTKSVEVVPILFSSANKMFATTVRPKQDRNAYNQLLAQKTQYQQQFRQSAAINSQLVEKQIKHKLSTTGKDAFCFIPNIQPLNSNWRFNLSMKPLQLSKREFPDRRTLFKSAEQEQRFLMSLRQFSTSSRR